jgi:hypothetical protein
MTVVGSGLGGFCGFAAESTYGTYVAPDHFYKVTQAQVNKVMPPVVGAGIAAGQAVQSADWRVYPTQAATGSVTMEIPTHDLGLILQHIMGGSATPSQVSETDAYLQTHALTATILGKSLSMQVATPDRGGTQHAWSLSGGKITSATFACNNKEIATLALEIDGQLLSDSQTAATPSYTAGTLPYHGGQLAVKLGTHGSEAAVVGVRGISAQIQRPINADDPYYFGAATAGTKAEPETNDFIQISGSLDIDLSTKSDFIDRFTAGTDTSMVLVWTGGLADTGENYFLEIDLPATFFDGDVPSLDGPGVTAVSVPFSCLYDGTNASTIKYQSTDDSI